MCRGIALKEAALQEHVQTERPETPGMSAFITHTHKHTLQLKHLSSAPRSSTPSALVKISLCHALSFPRKQQCLVMK